MEDLQYELYSVRKHGKNKIFFKICSILTLIAIAAPINIVPLLMGYNYIYFTGLFTMFLCFLLNRIFKSLNVAYEMTAKNDLFAVSKIVDEKKRTELATFSVKDCERIGSIEEPEYQKNSTNVDFVINVTEYKDFYSIKDQDVWYMFFKEGNLRLMVVFPMSSELYTIFRRYNAHRTMLYSPKIEVSDDSV